MAANGEEQASKLLRAQTHILNHLFSFINSMSLKCAIELGIADAIHIYGKPMPLSQLIASLQIPPNKAHRLHRLMRILAHSGFFKSQESVINNDEVEVSYVLTDASMLLLKDNPISVAPYLLALLDPVLTKPWYRLPAWFKSDDDTLFEMVNGMSLWDYAGREPKLNNLLNEAMASDSRLASSIVVDKCKWVFEGLESLVDVGGGTGTMAKAVAKAFPQVECMVYDLPHVVDGLNGSDNLKYVGGDMFESVPPAHAIMLKLMLHNWSNEECVEILKNCKEAITSNKERAGKIIIVDMVVGKEKVDDESVETQLFFDMELMVVCNGKERNEKEWAALISSVGFSDYKITPVLGLRSLIEIYP